MSLRPESYMDIELKRYGDLWLARWRYRNSPGTWAMSGTKQAAINGLKRLLEANSSHYCPHCNDTGIEPDAGTDANPEPPCTACNNGYKFRMPNGIG